VAYAREKYSIAIEHFAKALQSHPKCDTSASVRVAIAGCCFRLKQYDRAKVILEKALAIEVCSLFCCRIISIANYLT
jgi:TolA-binding protein